MPDEDIEVYLCAIFESNGRGTVESEYECECEYIRIHIRIRPDHYDLAAMQIYSYSHSDRPDPYDLAQICHIE